jgi:hypothetical protein
VFGQGEQCRTGVGQPDLLNQRHSANALCWISGTSDGANFDANGPGPPQAAKSQPARWTTAIGTLDETS